MNTPTAAAATLTTGEPAEAGADAPAGMVVRVRDHAAESWGHGLTNPVVRTVTISVACPRCGGPRGPQRELRSHDDGAYYTVDVWDNPCGHTDMYTDVLREALMLRARALPEHIIEFVESDHPGAALHHGACQDSDCLAYDAACRVVQAGVRRPPGRYALRIGDSGEAMISEQVTATELAVALPGGSDRG